MSPIKADLGYHSAATCVECSGRPVKPAPSHSLPTSSEKMVLGPRVPSGLLMFASYAGPVKLPPTVEKETTMTHSKTDETLYEEIERELKEARIQAVAYRQRLIKTYYFLGVIREEVGDTIKQWGDFDDPS